MEVLLYVALGLVGIYIIAYLMSHPEDNKAVEVVSVLIREPGATEWRELTADEVAAMDLKVIERT